MRISFIQIVLSTLYVVINFSFFVNSLNLLKEFVKKEILLMWGYSCCLLGVCANVMITFVECAQEIFDI